MLQWRPFPVFALCLATGLSLLAACSQVFAQSMSDYQVKAAYLYNFTKFVQWPAHDFPNPEAPFSCAS